MTANVSRRAFLAAGAAAAAGSALSACTGLTKPTSSASGRAATATIADLPSTGNATAKAQFKASKSAFLKKYPNLPVKWVAAESTVDALAHLPAELAAGTLNTLVNIPMASVYIPAGRGQLADITKLVEELPFYGDLLDELKAPLTINGKVYGFAAQGGFDGTIFNRKAYKAAGLDPIGPLTLDQFRENCLKLTNPSKGKYGWSTASGIAAGWYLAMLIYGAGGRIEVQEGDKWVTDLDGPEAVKVLSTVKAMRWEDQSIPPQFTSDEDMKQLVAAGKMGHYFQGSEQVSEITALGKSLGVKPGDIGLSVIPQDGKGGGYYDAVTAVFNPKHSTQQIRNALKWPYTVYLDPEAWEARCKATVDSGGTVAAVSGQELSLKSGSKIQAQLAEVTKKYSNIPREAFAGMLDHQPEPVGEPPVNSQGVYQALTPVMEKVLTDKKADVIGLLQEVKKKVQTILDNGSNS